jgi:RNA-directed DNA polymerase
MKEPYGEGVANHSGPESCGGARKGAEEALMRGARAGRILSLEKSPTFRVPTPSLWAEGNTGGAVIARHPRAWPGSKTPSTPGNSSHGSRESLESAVRKRWSGGPRWESPGSKP